LGPKRFEETEIVLFPEIALYFPNLFFGKE
jgi:hypothetical protein